MAKPIEHTAKFQAPIERLHAAFTSEQFFDERIEAVGGPGGRVDEFSVGADGTVTVKMMQIVPAATLPSLITKVRPGDLEIDRVQVWGPLRDGRADGSFTANIAGVPAKIGGTSDIAADGAGSVLTVNGEVSVKIPLVGGKIESAAVDQLTKLLDMEDEFTVKWLQAHP
ncbi:DUF2505 domain-containing protein [Aldersonia kunmingensis]|uniref:DUF2505 domain-containing protein n=1 Tax=Aldersonia kunmingensis TaxID=408066 RepID=UPI00082C2066|nr:DUF2505 domain-containing protein [Aldersonia kunmingensis]